ncbi:MAG TPA: VOC family protein [Candidatus Binatia bacterium]|jgi:catechol 2,3-dioxygenase-like lactoylglutathione lyase family enzyme|nr:VOC family protein [Candidatus Binatia bacterium]
MDSRIRYLAIVSERPEILARFYSTYFAMRELGRSDSGDISLTDGYYNVSLLKPRDGAAELGINHFGIAIDDILEIEARLEEFAPKADLRQEEGGLFHGDYRVTDPSGQTVSLSTHQFQAPSVERTFPSIRHLAVCVPNNDEVLDFYVNVFGFRESSTSKKIRESNRVVRWAADGATAMAILPDRQRRDMNEAESPRDGLNHFGWLVTNIEHFLNSLPEGCVSKRPDSRPMAEYRGFDPDRNPFDMSQEKGYEIDVDRWVRG